MYEPINPMKEVLAFVCMLTVFIVMGIGLMVSAALTAIIHWLPFIILAAGLSIAAIVWAWKSGRKQKEPEQPTRIIERQIVYILPPDSPRREVWQAIADGRADTLLLPDGEKVKVKK